MRTVIGTLPEKVSPDIRIVKKVHTKNGDEIHFDFLSEEQARVPGILALPHGTDKPLPLVMCLQGHNAGLRLSFGHWRSAKEFYLVKKGNRDLAIQALARGFAVLAIEQRCFGQRPDGRDKSVRQNNHSCQHMTMTAQLLGRTMIGERVWDVMRALDTVSQVSDKVDMERIACVGHSAGGTAAWYAACLDKRIKIVVPSCSLCTYVDSIGTRDHCMDNYLPGVLRHFDMGDLAGLIYPRTIVSVVGEMDQIFPIDGTQKAFEVVRAIYEKAKEGEGGEAKAGRCEFLVGPGGHNVYPELVWPVVKEEMNKLKKQ